ncbi:unnamed protein product [Gordionus sp. m RMFG-2023]|uniref:ubiquitin carboxyl-terminal hydrolase isozyme L3-like isoform X2 n=1 Tax=Gordionus sp. m RMFG-2023 TaxID=3053472 RepID=UPI0030E08F25
MNEIWMSQKNWLPLEGNPDYIDSLGVPDKWKFIDILMLDSKYLKSLPFKICAIIFLFPLNQNYDFVEFPIKDEDIYFCHQTIKNACGTLAIIHAILNNVNQIKLIESPFQKFYDSTIDKTPEIRAKILEEFQDIQNCHSELANQGQSSAPLINDNIDLHFITLISKNNFIYKLDGRNTTPMCLSTINDYENFLEKSVQSLKQVMMSNPNELRFSILALVEEDI